jgi:hypothetical protein
MLQKKNNDKSKYIFIWFNFIDLDKVQLILILIKKTLKNFIIVIFYLILTFLYVILSIKIKILAQNMLKYYAHIKLVKK